MKNGAIAKTREELQSALEMLQELRLKDSANCRPLAKEWLEEAVVAEDREMEGQFLLMLGQTNHNLGNPEESFQYAARGATLFEELGEHLGYARCQNIIALSEKSMGNGHRALTRLKSLLQYAEKHALLRTELVAYLNMGFVCSELSMLEVGIEYCKKGVEVLKRFPDQILAANLYNNLAFDTIRLGRYDEALDYCEKCFAAVDPEEDPVMYSIALETRSHLHAFDGNYLLAIADVEEAYQIQLRTKNEERQVECLLRLGGLHFECGNVSVAEEFVRRALAVSESIRFTPQRRDVLHKLAEILAAQGQHAEAFAKQRIAFEVAAEKAKSDFSRAISALEQGHEFDLAHRETELLREKNLQLQASEERFELAARGSSHGIWDWWLDQEHAYFSPRYIEMMGYTAETFTTRVYDHCDYIHPEDAALHEQRIKDAAEDGTLRSQIRMKTGAGEYRWFYVNAVVVKNENGEAVRMVGSLADITGRKVAEQELIAAKNRAEELSRLKSEFLANMSHEIRTPMNGVLGLTELLLMNDVDDESRSYLETIQTCGRSLLSIINEILDFSKIEAGKLELVHDEFDLGEIIVNTRNLFEAEAIRRKITFQAYKPAGALMVVGDQVRVQQILNNLVGNALKFTDAGEVTIRLELEPMETGRSKVTLSVRDTGVGIAEERLASIFDSFTQADGSTTRKYGGTGLGLTICRRLVELMEGNISVESQLGVGSTFTAKFELGTAEGAAQAASTGEEATPSAVRVLLVEDHAINRKLAGAQLQRLGCEFRAVEDGQQAVDLVFAEPFDLVFMDLQMPVLDGLEATRIIREREAATGNHLPIIALTANALPQDRKRCLDAGMDDYLSKPFVLRDLQQMIQKYVLSPNGLSQAA
jgi:PAS domain S-box-containing protein